MLHRYVGNPVLTGLLNLFFQSPIGDAHCGLRAFPKASCAKLGLATPGMEFASEMVVKASVSRQKITEVPIILYPTDVIADLTFVAFMMDGDTLGFMLMCTPTFLFLIPGLFLTLFGLCC